MPPQNLDRQITYEYSLIELLSSGSTRTSYDCIFSEGTPCRSSIWTTAREKPHWGMSGVPFMKSTSGLALTAPSIFARTSWVMKRSEPSLWAAKVFGTVLVADRRNRDCMATFEVTKQPQGGYVITFYGHRQLNAVHIVDSSFNQVYLFRNTSGTTQPLP